MSSAGTACEINPNFTSGMIGATTTMWAQQQRHPSPEDPWSESFVVGFEKRQVGGETRSQPKISVAARSKTKTVITRRAVEKSAISIYLNDTAITAYNAPASQKSSPGRAAAQIAGDR